jgi:hypothetical protein
MNRRGHLRILGVKEKIILRFIFGREDVELHTVFFWLKIRSRGGQEAKRC